MVLDEVGYYGPNILDGANIIFFGIFYKQLWLYIILGILLNRLLNGVLKQIFRVKRQEQIPFYGHIAKCYAMPSGHTQSVTYATTLMYFFNIYAFAIFLFVTLCTMRQRYVYRNHTIPQIIIGGIVGVCAAIFTIFFIKQKVN